MPSEISSLHATTPGTGGFKYSVVVKDMEGVSHIVALTDSIEVVDILFQALSKRIPDDMKPYSG